MKMNYIVNTRHSEDAYRVYAKVHMEARATPLTKAVSILVGLFCIAGGVMAMMNGGFRVLYAITVLVGVLCILSQPLGLWNMRRRLLKNASNIQQNIDYFFDENGFTVEYAKQKGFDTVYIDTAGRLHIDEALMRELADINRYVHPDEILLTVDAMTGQDIVNVAKTFKETLPLTGLVVTKFDGDSRGGGVLSVKKITGVPIKFVGEGEKLEDMGVFHPDRMADRILGMGDVVSLVEKAQEKLDTEENARMAERMMQGQFTMDDLLKQFEQIEKLGPLGGIMKMLPGMNQYADMLDDAKTGKMMGRTKAIIQSMTKWERENPSKIRGSMKKRIAAGSGTRVDDVNKLLNQFSRMKKGMDRMAALNRSGNLNEQTLERMMNNAQAQMDPRQMQRMQQMMNKKKW